MYLCGSPNSRLIRTGTTLHCLTSDFSAHPFSSRSRSFSSFLSRRSCVPKRILRSETILRFSTSLCHPRCRRVYGSGMSCHVIYAGAASHRAGFCSRGVSDHALGYVVRPIQFIITSNQEERILLRVASMSWWYSYMSWRGPFSCTVASCLAMKRSFGGEPQIFLFLSHPFGIHLARTCMYSGEGNSRTNSSALDSVSRVRVPRPCPSLP